ncbi:MAG: holo-ACP synthase [Rickettsiaceae bacterium]|nr:holo-ACP synthase [Rickettsiaceae bacterium]
MIIGIGTDVLNVERIQKMIDKYGDKFVSRILSDSEIEIFQKNSNKICYLARRFAGKEAIFKALGTGIGKPFRFSDISIMNDEYGKPEVKITNRQDAENFYIESKNINISLSDDMPVVVAFAVISS